MLCVGSRRPRGRKTHASPVSEHNLQADGEGVMSGERKKHRLQGAQVKGLLGTHVVVVGGGREVSEFKSSWAPRRGWGWDHNQIETSRTGLPE